MITNDGHFFAYAQNKVRKYVSDSGPWSVIHSHEWPAYACLSNIGYRHKTVNHRGPESLTFVLENVLTHILEL